MTFDELTARMCAAFEAEAGFPPDDASDAGIRIRVLAGEVMNALYRLSALAADAFPQTAAGKALENHAGQRGFFRRPAVPSVGTLTFSRETPLGYDVGIPAGTVCAASGAAVEFETTEDAVLPAGALQVTAAARAVAPGRGGNAAIGAVDTLVAPPAGIESVTNPTAFSGGADEETDESLRARLLAGYAVLPNGVNAETYRRAALSVPGVCGAGVKPQVNGAGTVGVYVYGNGVPVSEDVLAVVKETIEAMREIQVTVTVENATVVPRRITVYILPKAGCTFAEAQAMTAAAAETYFSTLTVGSRFTKAALIAAVMQTGAVENCTFPKTTEDYAAGPHEIVTLDGVTVLREGEEDE